MFSVQRGRGKVPFMGMPPPGDTGAGQADGGLFLPQRGRMSLATGEGEGKNPRQGRINDEERTLSLITPSVRTGGLFASLLFCLQNLPPAAFASAKVPAGGSTGALVRNDTGDGGLAEFAPAGAKKVQSVFCGGVYLAKNTSRGASVRACECASGVRPFAFKGSAFESSQSSSPQSWAHFTALCQPWRSLRRFSSSSSGVKILSTAQLLRTSSRLLQ